MKIVALHSSTNGVQYFSNENSSNPLQEAYINAVSGDTIYLSGGTFVPPATFDKSLTVYGAGYHPDSTEATQISTISGNVQLGDNADGFYLEGVKITGQLKYLTDISINNVTIKRCYLDSSTEIPGTLGNFCVNNIFTENIFMASVNAQNTIGAQFYNNSIHSINNLSNAVLSNNVFHYNSSAPPVNYANACIFNNNVFAKNYNSSYVGGNGVSTYNHNIFAFNNPILGQDPIISENYYIPITDIFIIFSPGSFSFTNDYHLTTTALNYVGTDGFQIGLYGGSSPYKEKAIPVNPHINSAVISSESTNGQINVNIQVQAQPR